MTETDNTNSLPAGCLFGVYVNKLRAKVDKDSTTLGDLERFQRISGSTEALAQALGTFAVAADDKQLLEERIKLAVLKALEATRRKSFPSIARELLTVEVTCRIFHPLSVPSSWCSHPAQVGETLVFQGDWEPE